MDEKALKDRRSGVENQRVTSMKSVSREHCFQKKKKSKKNQSSKFLETESDGKKNVEGEALDQAINFLSFAALHSFSST